MSLTLMILAAGVGSRYGGLKQLDPVGPDGSIIMDYSIFDARRAGFDRVLFIIRRAIEKDFREAIGRRFEKRIETAYAFQEMDRLPAGVTRPPERQKPWGTGHAMLVCRDQIAGPFAVINADDFYGPNAFRLLADFLRRPKANGHEYAMVGYTLRETLSDHGAVARGICESFPQDPGGAVYLRHLVEATGVVREGRGAQYADAGGATRHLTGDEWVSMNAWGFTPAIYDHLERAFCRFLEERGHEPKSEFYIPVCVDRLVAEQKARVRILPGSDRWYGITYREDKPLIEAALRDMIARGLYGDPLWG